MPLYELEEGTSRKFYRIEREGTRVVLRWGRIGSAGERKVVECANEPEAQAEYDAQIAKRRAHGYRLVLDESLPHDPNAERQAKLARGAPLTSSPRFWFVHKKKGFAWIEARGAVLVVARGKTGEENVAKPSETVLASASAANRERDALTAKLLAEGYTLESFGAAETKKPAARPAKKALASNPKLEAAVASSQDEPSWRAYEDWLAEAGDPRAACVTHERAGDDAEAAMARGKLTALLWGRHKSIEGALSETRWRAGHLVEARIDASESDATFDAFVQAPATNLLRTVHVSRVTSATLASLASAPFAPALRAVDFQFDARETFDAAHLDAFTNLRDLRLVGAARVVHRPCLEKIVTLDLLPATDDLDALLREPFPNLRRLYLVVREADRVPDLLATLAALPHLPALVDLCVHSYEKARVATPEERSALLGGAFSYLTRLELSASLLGR